MKITKFQTCEFEFENPMQLVFFRQLLFWDKINVETIEETTTKVILKVEDKEFVLVECVAKLVESVWFQKYKCETSTTYSHCMIGNISDKQYDALKDVYDTMMDHHEHYKFHGSNYYRISRQAIFLIPDGLMSIWKYICEKEA